MTAPGTPKEAQGRAREAFAAIGRLGRRELDAVEAWVASGCEGTRPQPDAAERQRLAAELEAALDVPEKAKRQGEGKNGR